MKITRPLYQIAVRGTLRDVGTFRHTAHGAILTTTPKTTPSASPAARLARWRFAAASTRASANGSDAAATPTAERARLIASAAATATPQRGRLILAATASQSFRLSDFLPARSLFRSFQP